MYLHRQSMLFAHRLTRSQDEIYIAKKSYMYFIKRKLNKHQQMCIQAILRESVMNVFDKKTQAITSPQDKYIVSKPPFPFRGLQKYKSIIQLLY